MQFENGHFKKCNDWLATRYGPDGIIDWSLGPTKKKATPSPSSDKENSGLADPTSTAHPASEDHPVEQNEDVLDEFDDADALEALVAAEHE
jgi:uracil-DNA glycosylase